MLPTHKSDLQNEIVFQVSSSETYHLNRENKFLAGSTEGLEAVRQAVYLILCIDRYEYVIYSWNYGVELSDLFGKPVYFVCAVLPERIQEALLQDDRIEAVDNFTFDTKKDVVSVTFTVHSKFGDFQETKEVKI